MLKSVFMTSDQEEYQDYKDRKEYDAYIVTYYFIQYVIFPAFRCGALRRGALKNRRIICFRFPAKTAAYRPVYLLMKIGMNTGDHQKQDNHNQYFCQEFFHPSPSKTPLSTPLIYICRWEDKFVSI
jgi:hypothetical protein